MSRLTGAVAGGLLAGLGLSALLLAGERGSGRPSELVTLGRAGARRLRRDVPPDSVLPDAREQAIVQGGHLALSALAGATYAATTDEEADILVYGIGFGLLFYASMHWIAGPLLRLKPPEWRSGKGTIAAHAANHMLFGLATAAGARIAR